MNIRKKLRTKQLVNAVVLIAVVGFFSCKKELTANEIVTEAVKAHGTLSEWKNIHSLSFLKKTILYTKDGSVEKELIQRQQFEFNGKFRSEITSLKDSVSHEFRDDKVFRSNQDSVTELKGTTLAAQKRAFASAFYVTSQPFHLLESQAELQIEKDTLIGKNQAIAIKVRYSGDTKGSDQWTYYFDKETYRVLACKVYHKPTTSFIENTSFDTATSFVFNATRTSTFIKNGKKDYVRAKYWYSDYQIRYK